MSENTPLFPPLIRDLPSTVPFVGPEAQERARGAPFAARIGANESVFGPSPRAVEAIAAAAAGAWMYGDPETHELREAVAASLGIAPGSVMIGEGIDGLLGVTCRLFLAPGAPVVTSLGGYPTFNYHVSGLGGVLHPVPYRDDRADLDALAAKATATQAKIVYLANPDNPMGGVWDAGALARFRSALPPETILLLDEAYGETAPAETLPPLDPADDRVLRFRTFSKAQGLAGLRVGYVIGHPVLIDAYNKIRNHFGVGRVAQAGALAALQDRAWLTHVVAEIAASRDRIAAIARENGLVPLLSATNFVAIDCGRDGAFAKAVLSGLLARGIFVRMPGVAPLDRCIRVSCGTAADLDAFATALPAAVAEARGA